jgi:hypothetical protein
VLTRRATAYSGPAPGAVAKGPSLYKMLVIPPSSLEMGGRLEEEEVDAASAHPGTWPAAASMSRRWKDGLASIGAAAADEQQRGFEREMIFAQAQISLSFSPCARDDTHGARRAGRPAE